MKQQYWFIVVVLIGALLIGACSNKDEPQVAGSGSDRESNGQSGGSIGAEDLGEQPDLQDTDAVVHTSLLDGIEPLAAGTTALPAIEGIDGSLVAVVDEALVYARFDGEPASLIHEEVTPFTVEVLPNHRIAFVGRQSEGGRGDSAYVYNLDTGEFDAEYPLNAGGAIIGWSDDGAWMTIGEFQNNAQVVVVSTDGSFRSEGLANGFDMAWMTDNTGVLMLRDPDNNFAAYGLRHYDPSTDTITDLDIPVVEELNLSIATFEVELAGLGYTMSDNYLFFDRTDANEAERWLVPLPEELATNNQVVCAPWPLRRMSREEGTFDIAYVAEDTHRLTDLHLLSDGSALVIRWFREGCGLSSPLEAHLLRISGDGNVSVVVDNILVDSNEVQNFNLERRYSVSPDGRFVVWASQEGGTLQNPALDMIDLATGARLRLFSAADGDNSFIRSVTWVD